MAVRNVYAPPGASLSRPAEPGDTRLFALNGRIGRYLWLAYTCTGMVLAFLLAVTMFALLARTLPAAHVFMTVLFGIAVSVITCIMSYRRLQDLDIGRRRMLLALVPIVNFYFLFLMAFRSGSGDPNRYGPPPPKNHPATWLMIVPILMVVAYLAFIADLTFFS